MEAGPRDGKALRESIPAVSSPAGSPTERPAGPRRDPPEQKSRGGRRGRCRRAGRAREEMVGGPGLTTRPPVRGWTRAGTIAQRAAAVQFLPLARADGRARVSGSSLRLVSGDVLRVHQLLPGTALLRRELPGAGHATCAASGQSTPPADARGAARSSGSDPPVASAAPHERDGYGSPKTCVPGSLVAAERSGGRHHGGARDGRRRRPR